MSKLKKVFARGPIALFLVTAVILTMWGTTRTAEAKSYRFTMQNMFSMNHPVTLAVQEFSKEVKKASNGKISVQVLPSGALVKGPEIFETVGNGAIDMGTTCSCYHGGILPVAATAFALPGDPRGVNEIMDFIYTPETMKFLQDAYATQNVRYCAPMVWDGYTIVSKEPIKTWEDLKKLKVRASGSIAKTLQKMGVPTVFIPFSEIYVALSRGTIDAEISGSHTESYLAQTYEVAKYQTVPEISGAQNCEIIMNKDRWDELPRDLQDIMAASLEACSKRCLAVFNKENAIAKEKMLAKGAKFIKLPDDVMDRWMKTAVALWDEKFAKQDELSAQYLDLVKKDLNRRGYQL